ncbi:MAG: hypothetical protein ABJF50_03355 [Paracoccaceae bacterium]
MDNDPRQDQALAALFSAAKDNAPTPTPDFMERLACDADAALPKYETSAPAPAPSILSSLKGLFAASGLTVAAALGVWIGLVMPETLNTLVDGFAVDDTVSLSAFLPGADLAALSE